jgi:hypothetical protein
MLLSVLILALQILSRQTLLDYNYHLYQSVSNYILVIQNFGTVLNQALLLTFWRLLVTFHFPTPAGHTACLIGRISFAILGMSAG